MREIPEHPCGMDGSGLNAAFHSKCWDHTERNDEGTRRPVKFLRQDLFDEHSCERMAQDIWTLTIPVLTVDQDGMTHRRGCDSEVGIGSEHGLGRGNAERVGQPDAVEHPDQVRAHWSAEGGSALCPTDHLVVVKPLRQRLSCRSDGETQLCLSWRDSHEHDACVWGWQWIERNIAELKIVDGSAVETQLPA